MKNRLTGLLIMMWAALLCFLPASSVLAQTNAAPEPVNLGDFFKPERIFAPAVKTTAAIPAKHQPAPAPVPTPKDDPQTLWWVAVWLAGGVALFLLARILRELKTKTGPTIETAHAGQMIIAPPASSPPYVQVVIEGSTRTQSQTVRPWRDVGNAPTRMPEEMRAGVIANLSRWLKQKVVQRLLSDRSQLLATQEAAALTVLKVDKRLAKVERQIQQRNQEYEQRIDELLNALNTAREENRELIRAQIELVKAEMEKGLLETGLHGGKY